MGERYSLSMDILYRISMWIAGLALLVMVAVIPVGIFARYVMNSALSWPEPIAIICMVTFTFIGAAVSYRAGSHIAVSMVVDRLGEKARRICLILADFNADGNQRILSSGTAGRSAWNCGSSRWLNSRS
jgi:TRAP-type C4-dicarboxylate transport system, small permease component